MYRLLMCPPQYYGIEYEINPWMSRSRGADRERTAGQWQALLRLLREEVGARVELISPQLGLPDLVFTANAGLPFEDRFIASNFRYPQRQREAEHFGRWFEERGYQVVRLPAGHYFEGAGDALFAGKDLFAGYHFRSEIEMHSLLSEITGRRVISLELVDPRFYHLDTCFCPLAGGEVIWHRPAFDEYAQRAIEAWRPERIEVAPEEALRFACNAIALGRNVILNEGCPRLARELEGRGYRVFSCDLSEFLKAGGSAKCLTLRLDGGWSSERREIEERSRVAAAA